MTQPVLLPEQTASSSASFSGSLSLSVRDCRALVAPVVKGTENLPDPLGPRRPLLFVGMNVCASSTSLFALQSCSYTHIIAMSGCLPDNHACSR